MIVINLFGAPGAGKSTGAAYVFSKLKMKGINVELITEYVKDKVWEETTAVFENQAYIFGKQSFRISRCANKVDAIITDSPLPLSIFYNQNKQIYKDNFNNFVMDVYNHYNNVNFFIKRVKPYNEIGRFQTEKESDDIEIELYNFMKQYNIKYDIVCGDEVGYNFITDYIINLLHKEN